MSGQEGQERGFPMIGQVIAKYRSARGLTQDDLARRTGLSRGTIGQIETSFIKWPRPDTLQVLANAIGVPLSQIFYEAGIIQPEEMPVSRELETLTRVIPELNELLELAKEHPDKVSMFVRLIRCLLKET